MTRSDQELGGFSTVNFDVKDGVGYFHGYLNLDPPPNRPDIVFSGYAMFRTRDQTKKGILGIKSSFWNWSPYHHLELRVKGDFRKYFINIQTDSPLVTDIYQHRLFLNTPGEWETVVIPIDDFVLTNWGNIQEQGEMEKERVKTIGIGLLDKQFGPFGLYIDYIKVLTANDVKTRVKDELLKNKKKDDDDFFGNARV